MAKDRPTVLAVKPKTDISIREISNGFIIRETSINGKGEFQEKETFTRLKPDIKVST